MRASLALTALATVFLAGCETGPSETPRGAPDPRPCFNVQMLRDYEIVDGDTLRLEAGARRYDIDLSGPQCDRIEWTRRTAIESTSSAWICVGDQPGSARVAFQVPGDPRAVECWIDAVRVVEPPSR